MNCCLMFFLTCLVLGQLSATVNLEFVVDEYYLAGHALSNDDKSEFSSPQNQEGILAFQYRVKCENEIGHRLLPNSHKMLPELYRHEQIIGFIDWAKALPEFGHILEQTLEYREKCIGEWNATYPVASVYVEELTGLKLDKSMKVYLTHPSLRNGQYIGNNTIEWGCHGPFKCYGTVYLWHEILHSFLPYTDVAHCVIQMIADNGLRILFNPDQAMCPLVGHQFLDPMMNEIFPHWESYLLRDKKDIFAFIQELESVVTSHQH